MRKLAIILILLLCCINIAGAINIVNLNYTMAEHTYPHANWSETFGGTNIPNLIPNPGFEQGTIDWTFKNATINTTYVHTGINSTLLYPNGVATWCSVKSGYIAVQPNTIYEVGAWVYILKGSNVRRKLNVLFYNSTYTLIGSTTNYLAMPQPTTGYVHAYYVFRTPANCTYVRISFVQGAGVGDEKTVVDDLSLREFSALMLDIGSIYAPMPLNYKDLPKTVILRAKINLGGNWIITNVTNWQVALNGQPLTLNSATYNASSGWWELSVVIPQLNPGVYNVTVQCNYTITGYHFYTRGKIWVYNANQLNDLLIAQTSDPHIVDRFDPRNNKTAYNIVNWFYCADQIVKIHPDIAIDTGDYGNSISDETPRLVIAWVDYLNAHGIPVFLDAGNHEGHPKYNITNQDQYWKYVKYLGCPDRYYSVDFGKYHITAIWTDEENTAGSSYAQISQTQLDWIKHDLQTADAQGKTIIFLEHTPVYCPVVGGSKWANTTQAALIKEWIDKYNVSVVLQGHYHFTPPYAERINNTLWTITLTYGALFGDGPIKNPGFRLVRINDTGTYTWWVGCFKKTYYIPRTVIRGNRNIYGNVTFEIDKNGSTITIKEENETFKSFPIQINSSNLYLHSTLYYHPHQENLLLLHGVDIGVNVYKKLPATIQCKSNATITVTKYTSQEVDFRAHATAPVTFKLGGLLPSHLYIIKVDGKRSFELMSDGYGTLSFKWTRWSTHDFQIISVSNFMSKFVGMAVVLVVSGIVFAVVFSIAKKYGFSTDVFKYAIVFIGIVIVLLVIWILLM